MRSVQVIIVNIKDKGTYAFTLLRTFARLFCISVIPLKVGIVISQWIPFEGN